MFGPRPAPSAVRVRAGRAAPLLAAGAIAAVLSLAAGGCGGTSSADDGVVRGHLLTVYSSMPYEGPDRAAARDVVRGEQLALARDGGQVGRYRVRLVSLDAATPKARSWDPSQISRNARRAAADPSAVAYVGELHGGSSAISIPLLNEAGIVQVSPLDGALAYTTPSLAIPGSPERYYPRIRTIGRTFARLVPNDRLQALALLRLMRERGVRRLALLGDEDAPGAALLEVVRRNARAAGVTLVADEEIDGPATQHRDLVAKVRIARPDAALYAGGQDAGGTAILWRELRAADPGLLLLAPVTLADGRFLTAIGAAGIGTSVVSPVRPLATYPPAAARIARDLRARYGTEPRAQALYGYEAMRVVLAAIRTARQRAGAHALTRAEVARAFFALPAQSGVLGGYALDRHGDTSLRRFGVYRVAGGQLRFAGAVDG